MPSYLSRLAVSNLVILVRLDLLCAKTLEHFDGTAIADEVKLIDSNKNGKAIAIGYFMDLVNGDIKI